MEIVNFRLDGDRWRYSEMGFRGDRWRYSETRT